DTALDGSNYITINGVDIQSGTSASEIAAEINANISGVVATVDGGKLKLTAADGRNITIAVTGDAGDSTGLADGTTHGSLTITGGSEFSIEQNTSDFLGIGGTSVTSQVDDNTSVQKLDISTKDGAQ